MDIMSTSDDRKNLLSERIVRILRDIKNINYVNGDKEITEKVIKLLEGRELSLETYKAVNEFLDKMKTKINIKNNTFIFEIHDTIKYYVRDASPERCGNIDDFLSLIRGLVEYINNPPKKNVGFKDEPLFTHTATIAIGNGFNNSNKVCGVYLDIDVVNGGSKSWRKPVRKTRRGRTRKSKTKSKTHRRKRSSCIRKHKKYTSRRRR